ncbi:MAG: hypothetical protein ACO3FO_04665 [Candidatus Nanopelagicaceae bacterium]
MKMANANAPKIGHIYDPISDETITDNDGFVEVIITDRTKWQQLCDSNVTITNAEYKELFDAFEVREDCENCSIKAIQDDPYGFIYDV